jgi:hypothetical protein
VADPKQQGDDDGGALTAATGAAGGALPDPSRLSTGPLAIP